MGQRQPDVDEAPVLQPSEEAPARLISPALLGALVGAVVLAVLLSVFIVMRIIGPQVEQQRIAKEEMEQMGQTIEAIVGRIAQFPLEPVVVNLAGSNAERYLKTSIVLGYERMEDDDEDRLGAELDKRRPEVRNQVISILQTKKLEEVDSPEGREAIRREILNRVNAMLVSGRVINVYYTDFVVQ